MCIGTQRDSQQATVDEFCPLNVDLDLDLSSETEGLGQPTTNSTVLSWSKSLMQNLMNSGRILDGSDQNFLEPKNNIFKNVDQKKRLAINVG